MSKDSNASSAKATAVDSKTPSPTHEAFSRAPRTADKSEIVDKKLLEHHGPVKINKRASSLDNAILIKEQLAREREASAEAKAPGPVTSSAQDSHITKSETQRVSPDSKFFVQPHEDTQSKAKMWLDSGSGSRKSGGGTTEFSAARDPQKMDTAVPTLVVAPSGYNYVHGSLSSTAQEVYGGGGAETEARRAEVERKNVERSQQPGGALEKGAHALEGVAAAVVGAIDSAKSSIRHALSSDPALKGVDPDKQQQQQQQNEPIKQQELKQQTESAPTAIPPDEPRKSAPQQQKQQAPQPQQHELHKHEPDERPGAANLPHAVLSAAPLGAPVPGGVRGVPELTAVKEERQTGSGGGGKRAQPEQPRQGLPAAAAEGGAESYLPRGVTNVQAPAAHAMLNRSADAPHESQVFSQQQSDVAARNFTQTNAAALATEASLPPTESRRLAAAGGDDGRVFAGSQQQPPPLQQRQQSSHHEPQFLSHVPPPNASPLQRSSYPAREPSEGGIFSDVLSPDRAGGGGGSSFWPKGYEAGLEASERGNVMLSGDGFPPSASLLPGPRPGDSDFQEYEREAANASSRFAAPRASASDSASMLSELKETSSEALRKLSETVSEKAHEAKHTLSDLMFGHEDDEKSLLNSRHWSAVNPDARHADHSLDPDPGVWERYRRIMHQQQQEQRRRSRDYGDYGGGTDVHAESGVFPPPPREQRFRHQRDFSGGDGGDGWRRGQPRYQEEVLHPERYEIRVRGEEFAPSPGGDGRDGSSPRFQRGDGTGRFRGSSLSDVSSRGGDASSSDRFAAERRGGDGSEGSASRYYQPITEGHWPENLPRPPIEISAAPPWVKAGLSGQSVEWRGDGGGDAGANRSPDKIRWSKEPVSWDADKYGSGADFQGSQKIMPEWRYQAAEDGEGGGGWKGRGDERRGSRSQGDETYSPRHGKYTTNQQYVGQKAFEERQLSSGPDEGWDPHQGRRPFADRDGDRDGGRDGDRYSSSSQRGEWAPHFQREERQQHAKQRSQHFGDAPHRRGGFFGPGSSDVSSAADLSDTIGGGTSRSYEGAQFQQPAGYDRQASYPGDGGGGQQAQSGQFAPPYAGRFGGTVGPDGVVRHESAREIPSFTSRFGSFLRQMADKVLPDSMREQRRYDEQGRPVFVNGPQGHVAHPIPFWDRSDGGVRRGGGRGSGERGSEGDGGGSQQFAGGDTNQRYYRSQFAAAGDGVPPGAPVPPTGATAGGQFSASRIGGSDGYRLGSAHEQRFVPRQEPTEGHYVTTEDYVRKFKPYHAAHDRVPVTHLDDSSRPVFHDNYSGLTFHAGVPEGQEVRSRMAFEQERFRGSGMPKPDEPFHGMREEDVKAIIGV